MSTEHSDIPPFPRMVVGIMGSAGGEMDPEVLKRLDQLGRTIASRGYVLVTGAAPGMTHAAVLGAKAAGGFVVGISPALNLEEHMTRYKSPTRGYDTLIYTGSGLMGREIENIRTCDVVIFAGGRSGTLGEFAIAYDEGKIIGVLEGTGGVTEHIHQIIDMVEKRTGAYVRSHLNPEILMDMLEKVYQELVLPGYVAAAANHNPDGIVEA
jgi:uncharacterized protein (TIGR00725 family)